MRPSSCYPQSRRPNDAVLQQSQSCTSNSTLQYIFVPSPPISNANYTPSLVPSCSLSSSLGSTVWSRPRLSTIVGGGCRILKVRTACTRTSLSSTVLYPPGSFEMDGALVMHTFFFQWQYQYILGMAPETTLIFPSSCARALVCASHGSPLTILFNFVVLH